jgi:hypothetical protein
MNDNGLGQFGVPNSPYGVTQGFQGIGQGAVGAALGGDPTQTRVAGAEPGGQGFSGGLDIGTLAGLAAILPGLMQKGGGGPGAPPTGTAIAAPAPMGGSGNQKPGMMQPSMGGAGAPKPGQQQPQVGGAGTNRGRI